ncbi:unnamed protein product [Nesidiocoris tenuis]|uniref:Uncharacterized protein n=1 Tax=Nesidiocoris tenuis TaxID=355587 RepID=A0A6H5H454_9HEMI|nr:unnamed protein product [Nesidiocoris tenuis]
MLMNKIMTIPRTGARRQQVHEKESRGDYYEEKAGEEEGASAGHLVAPRFVPYSQHFLGIRSRSMRKHFVCTFHWSISKEQTVPRFLCSSPYHASFMIQIQIRSSYAKKARPKPLDRLYKATSRISTSGSGFSGRKFLSNVTSIFTCREEEQPGSKFGLKPSSERRRQSIQWKSPDCARPINLIMLINRKFCCHQIEDHLNSARDQFRACVPHIRSKKISRIIFKNAHPRKLRFTGMRAETAQAAGFLPGRRIRWVEHDFLPGDQLSGHESDLLISLAEDHDPLKWDHTLGPVRAGDDSGTEHVYGVRGAPCRATGLRARYLFSTSPYNTDLLIQEPDQKLIIGHCDRFSSNTNPVRKTHEMLLGSKTRRPVIGLILFAARSRRAALAAFARLEIRKSGAATIFGESVQSSPPKLSLCVLERKSPSPFPIGLPGQCASRWSKPQLLGPTTPKSYQTADPILARTHQQLEKIRPFLSVLLVKFSAARFRLRCGNRKAQYVAGRATYDSKDEGPAGGSAGSRTELSAQTPNWICWMAKGLAALEVRTDRWGLEASAPRQTCWVVGFCRDAARVSYLHCCPCNTRGCRRTGGS